MCPGSRTVCACGGHSLHPAAASRSPRSVGRNRIRLPSAPRSGPANIQRSETARASAHDRRVWLRHPRPLHAAVIVVVGRVHYRPLQRNVESFRTRHRGASDAEELAESVQREIDIWRAYGDFYGYECFVMRSRP